MHASAGTLAVRHHRISVAAERTTRSRKRKRKREEKRRGEGVDRVDPEVPLGIAAETEGPVTVAVAVAVAVAVETDMHHTILVTKGTMMTMMGLRRSGHVVRVWASKNPRRVTLIPTPILDP